MDDLYLILGVEPDANPGAIQERFRFLAQAYHPDKFSSPKQKLLAEEEFKKINNAYQILSNPRKRTDYDLQRKSPTNYSRTNANDINRKAEEATRQRAQEEQKKKAEEVARQREQKASQDRREALKQQKLQFITCPECKETNPISVWNCLQCGRSLRTELNQRKQESIPRKESSNNSKVKSEIVVCPNCKEYNSIKNWHCIKCGTRL